MRFDFLTLFPDMCSTVMNYSIIGRAVKKNIIQVCYHNIRDFAYDKHKRVDDTVYGGGQGMLMLAEPIALCFESLCDELQKRPLFIYMSPKGKPLTQEVIKNLSKLQNIAILCGHYEGVDQRVIDSFIDVQLSIGDFVLTGGELPALILADSIGRLLPGVLSNSDCFQEESLYNGLLEYPQYTKPAIWRGQKVPEVLLSGHHANIQKWKRLKSVELTALHRPDLIKEEELTDTEKQYIKNLRNK